MAKLILRLAMVTRALVTLKVILDEPFTVIVRNAAIQRFAYTFAEDGLIVVSGRA